MIVFPKSIQTGCESHPVSCLRGLVQALCPSGTKVACGMELTTHLRLMLRLRMSGAIPSFLFMPLWHAQGPLYLHFSKTFNHIFMLSIGRMFMHRN
jgi:hypothetical protein